MIVGQVSAGLASMGGAGMASRVANLSLLAHSPPCALSAVTFLVLTVPDTREVTSKAQVPSKTPKLFFRFIVCMILCMNE